jgi:glucose/arabinose dehydrogenase
MSGSSTTPRRTGYRFLLPLLAGLVLLGTLRAAFVEEPSGPVAPAASIALQQLAMGLPTITSIASAGDARLFLTYQSGQIAIWDPTQTPPQILPTFFLNIDSAVSNGGGEQGLLGLAFHPQYASNGFFFVYYTNNSGDNVVARYQVSADPNVANGTGVILMTISHPHNSNHNGGQLQFGPDGFLYIGPGDGGSGDDPPCNAQNKLVRLGKLLRIDVNVPTDPFWSSPPSNPYTAPNDPGLDEIWAIGLRNPWRFSFDRLTGDLWIADVGQGQREEIDFQPSGSAGGQNYGWKVVEGTRCTGDSIATCTVPPPPCGSSLYTAPVFEYDHSQGCAVVGGYVYRGTAIPALYGIYLYGDFCSGNLWESGQKLSNPTLPNLSTFGQDAAGELYAATTTGSFYRIVEAVATPTPTSTPPPTLTKTSTPTRISTPTVSRTQTPTSVPPTPTPTSTRTPTSVPPTPTPTSTRTPTSVPPTPTPTPTPTSTRTPTSVPPTPTPTNQVPTNTWTPSPTNTVTTPTNPPTQTPTSTPTPKVVVVPPLTDFRDVRRPADINLGPDLGGTGHQAINFTGAAASAGDTWITVYDTTPTDDTVENIFGSVRLSADVLIHSYNNGKGAGLLALFNEAAGKTGLALIPYDSGNSDRLDLGTVNKATGHFTRLATVSLGAGINENAWYRLTMDVVISGTNVTVTGRVFRHTTATDPNSSLNGQVGGTLSFSGVLPAGVDATGEIGVAASAFSAAVNASATNFTIDP